MAEKTNKQTAKEHTAKPRKNAREKARKARNTAVASVKSASTRAQLDGFMDFIRTQGVVGLAIGIVIGTQVKALTDQLVASFINPIVGLVLPGSGDLAQKTFVLTIGQKQAIFHYGAFIAVLISFITVAAVVYYIIKGLKLDKLDKKKE